MGLMVIFGELGATERFSTTNTGQNHILMQSFTVLQHCQAPVSDFCFLVHCLYTLFPALPVIPCRS